MVIVVLKRGEFDSRFFKKTYSIELWNSDDEDIFFIRNGKEEDWILHMVIDKSQDESLSAFICFKR